MEGSILINSKSSAIRSLLLTAWRCKWSDIEWANGMKKVLPRGVNGDVYDLADIILKQALIGPAPNQLFISYLNYSIKTKLVSHGSVLAAIARLCDDNLTQNKPLAIICLLEFIISFRDKISCTGTEEDCIHLCRSIGDVVYWLIKCVHNSILKICSNSSITSTANTLVAQQQQQLQAGNMSQQNLTGSSDLNSANCVNINSNFSASTNAYHPSSEHHKVIELSTEIIAYLIRRPFTMALLYIFKLEYEQKFRETMKTFNLVEKITLDPTVVNSIQARDHLDVIANFSQRMNSLDSHPSVVAARQLMSSSLNNSLHHNNRLTNIYHKSNQRSDLSGQLSHHFMANASLDSSPSQALFACLYSLVAFDVVLWPVRNLKFVANQISTIKDFYNLPLSTAYCEIIRICLIGSVDAKGTTDDGKWAVFTFLKMPHLLRELNRICYSSQSSTATATPNNINDSHSGSNGNISAYTLTSNQYAQDLITAIEKLNGYTPLLDLADTKCNCDFLGCLVKELSKTEISIMTKLHDVVIARQTKSKSKPTIGTQDSGLGLQTVLRAEPTMLSILRGLNTDYSKDQAQLLRFLCQMVNGKSFELILSAAAASGRLQIFTSKLIEFNESSRQCNDENGKSSLLRSLLFDITFLMLCHIVNNYGCEALKPNDRNSTFASWYLRFYNQDTRLNCPNQLLSYCDGRKVGELLNQLLSLTVEQNNLQTSNMDWREVCQNIPSAINEVMNAWQQDLLTDNMVKTMAEKIKSKMCFMGLVIASWLRAYIKTLSEEGRKKPLILLQEFTRSTSLSKYQQSNGTENNASSSIQNNNDNSNVAGGSTDTMNPINGDNNLQQAHQDKDGCSQATESYKERSSLMCHIVKKVFNELTVPHSSNNATSTSTQQSSSLTSDSNEASTNKSWNNGSQSNTQASLQSQIYASNNRRFSCTTPNNEILVANFDQSLERGWTDLRSLHTFEALIKLIGCRSFSNQIVERILLLESPSDLNRAVDIVFGLFHLNIEEFALALVEEIIVDNLICEQKQLNLIQPRAYALARLSVMTIIEAIRHLKLTLSESDKDNDLRQTNKQQHQVRIKTEPGYSTGTTNNTEPMDISESMIVYECNDHIDKKPRIDANLSGANGDSSLRTTADLQQSPIFVATKETQDTLNQLESSLKTLMRLFKKIMSDSTMSQRTLFPVLFLEQTVICANENAHDITRLTPSSMLMDIIKLFSNELTFELALAISNLSTTESRWAVARAICDARLIK